jgi:hypothetical protein
MVDLLRNGVLPGLVGAGALTGLHEAVRHRRRDAPRVDVVGMRALARLYEASGVRPPRKKRLHRLALLGDLVANSLYYGLLVAGQLPLWRGALGGALAGLGAVFLPPYLGLGRLPGNRRRSTRVMTVAWYLAGGLTAAAARALLMRGARRAA